MLFFALLISTLISSAQAQDPVHAEARALVHIMDYLGQDYAGAVEDGKILNQEEYQEQVEFVQEAETKSQRVTALKKDPQIASLIKSLKTMILTKRPSPEVFALSQDIKSRIIETTQLPVAPTRWPEGDVGRRIFEQNCVSCHGVSGHGDGPAGVALEPKPTNFHNVDRMKLISPFQMFNTIRLGIKGTAMPSFSSLSEQDIWALAFYVASLQHQEKSDMATSTVIDQALARVPLSDVATKSDAEILESLSDLEEGDRDNFLIALRVFSSKDDGTHSLRKARWNLNEALTAYKSGEKSLARDKAIVAYLEGVEPIEPRLRAQGPELMKELEAKMTNLRLLIDQRAPDIQIESAISQVNEKIAQASDLIRQSPLSPWIAFVSAASILLREGLEALLIIIALMSVIRASGQTQANRWIHGGWISAVGLGFVVWFFSGWVLSHLGSKLELLEGVTSLFAVIILLYMGFWLHSKTESARWKSFIDDRVTSALQTQNLLAIGTMSFIAVFREAIESVLFLRTLWIQGGSPSKTALLIGVAAAGFVLMALAWILLRYAARIPIRQMFSVSSLLMIILAVVLVGKGFHALQENGTLSMTALSWGLKLEPLGIFPTLETCLSQLFVVGLSTALWFAGRRPVKSQAVAN